VTVEDRLRATSLAITDTMREVRPLTLPPVQGPAAARRSRVRTPRRWPPGSPGWLVPLAAAVAVVVIAAGLGAVRGLTAARPGARPATAATSAVGIPRYFVSLEDIGASPKGAIERNAFLADTGTGKRLATFKPPPDAIFDYAVGSSDGRTFVLEAAAGRGYGPSGNHALVSKDKTALWYVLRVTPGAARQARLARIPIASSFADTGSLGVAVSPDGRTLAILTLAGESPGKARTSHPPMVLLRTYSVATGQLLRTWAAPASAWVGPPSGLTWLDDDRTVAFVAPTVVPRQYIRTLDTTRPGSSLVAASRPVFTLPDLCGSPLLAADGKSVICGTVSALPAAKPACDKGGIRLVAYSVATGKLERVLYQYSGDCSWGSALMVWARSGTTAIAAIVVSGSAAPHPQISRLVAAASGKGVPLPVTTWNGYGSIAF
jgi:hypothetical protein